MSACLYFHPDGYTTGGRPIMGRHAAGESFLRGFLQDSRGEELWIQVDDPRHRETFAELARRQGRQEAIHVVDRGRLAELARPGVVFHPGPGLSQEAWQRSLFGHRSWSLCGIIHTICSAGAMESLTGLVTAPLQPWDALICTSEAGRAAVQELLAAQIAHLQERHGGSRFPLPQLPVIPLGVHTADFEVEAAERTEARRALACDEDTVVVLFLGRLSFHAKAHPLALYQALQRAAAETDQRVVLVECGMFANGSIREAFAEASDAACPGVTVVRLDGREPDLVRRAWAGADVFCSLSDNIQETFGITPLEAMAAGLPVVVSDWDGYRDTVRDGIDGFRISTRMPPAGLGADLAARHALGIENYDRYIAASCAFVAVDVAATALALKRLFASAELRQRMGEAGRRRARDHYDWRVILPRYRELWQELRRIRLASKDPAPLASLWPARPDPFRAFAGYPTAPLQPGTLLQLNALDGQAALQRLEVLSALAMVRYALPLMPGREELAAVLRAAAAGPQPAEQLLLAVAAERRPLMFRALLWLLKLDLLRLVGDPG
jgi:glycosyltransferase involved in cell wall biosynthesis